MSDLSQQISDLLESIGNRVRRAREDLKMSRLALSESSGVSPRYLASLESGDGNISISLLYRIASALNLSLEQIVRGNSSGSGQKSRRIALIGLRGAGKSTLGPMLADHIGNSFLELNHEIEKASNMPVPEIFSLYGGEGYRRLERRALEDIRNQNENLVLAVAGGIVANTQTYAFLLSHFHTIWLRTSPEDHMARVRAQGDMRPMSGSSDAMVALRGLLEQREPFYAKADAKLWTEANSENESLAELINVVNNELLING